MRGCVPVLLAFALGSRLAAAQALPPIEHDGSLGASGAVLPDAASNYQIEESAGRRSDRNLFHSFSRFSVPFGSSATFSGDPMIERVFARVTGDSSSQIDGTLRNSIDGADLYLMNPRGVVFNGTANLDLHGSFYVSSANALRFEDENVFSATPSLEPEVLSSAAPSAWGFTSDTSFGFIRFNQVRNVTGRNFGVPRGETLEAVGGTVSVSGFSPSLTNPTLRAPGGTIALASRSSVGEVPVDVAALAARGALAGDLGTVSIGNVSSNAVLDVSDASGLAPSRGRIVIRGGALTVDRSVLRAESARNAADATPDIDLETTRSILLRSSNPLGSTSVQVAARAGSQGGGLRLSSAEVTLSGRSTASSSASGSARAGTLEVSAGSLKLSEASRLATSATENATTGRLVVNARTVGLASGAGISSLNEASTDSSEVSINADELVRIESGAIVASQATGDGRGALLRLGAAKFEQATGARLESSTTGIGEGGGVEIRAGTVTLEGAPLGSDPGGVFAISSGSRAAGDIFIGTDDLVVAGGAQVSATAQSIGNGGDLEVQATSSVLLTGSSGAGPSGLFARSGLGPGTLAQGNGGSILVVAPKLDVVDGAEISAQTFGAGTAGGIRIVATDHVGIAGGASARSSLNAKAAIGAGGDIGIETGELRIDDGGEISASALDSGDSGDIEIEAQTVHVGGGEPSGLGPAGIFAQSIPAAGTGIDGGDGGDIEIRASKLLELRSSGVISVKTFGTGAAGSIRVAAPVVNVSDGGSVSASTLGTGDSGGVAIRNPDLVSIEGGEISARSEGSGAAGSVTLTGVGELLVGEGGSITTETLRDGAGGLISITADADGQVLLSNGGTISARSEGAKDAGSIEINAGRRFTASNGGQVTTAATVADGGDIEIEASELIYLLEGRLETRVEGGDGNGGNITLDPVFVVLNHAEVIASAVGDGGNITIDTRNYVRDAASVVDASSDLGINGEILITSPAVDLSSELAQLDTPFLDASSKLAAACAARAGERGTFAVRGRARPASPDAPLAAPGDADRAPSCMAPAP